MTTLEETEFYAKDLIAELVVVGLIARVEQTGGGTATIFVQNAPTEEPILIGPGSYNWGTAGNSVFTTEELYIGEDSYDLNDELKDYDPEAVSPAMDATVAEIAQMTKTEYDKLNSKESV
jgi:hypothetical protein